MFEAGGAGVKSLWQSCLPHILVILETLRYAHSRSHGIDQRWLIQPGNSVWWLSLSKIHQRRPGSTARLGRVDLKRALGRSDGLAKQLVLSRRTFFWDTSSSSSSDKVLSLTLSSVFRAAEKLTGEPSLMQDSEEEDLLTGERERVESLVSSKTLVRLTGVLGRLSGVLECLTGVSGLLGGDWSWVVVGVWTTGLDWASVAVAPSILRCMRVHIDMKSSKVAWLILLGIDGKMRLLTSETMETSCLSTGAFPAGVPWAAGPSSLAESSRAETCGCAESSPAESCGSAESSPAEFCGRSESAAAGSWCCAESATVAESYTISGSSTSDQRPPADS